MEGTRTSYGTHPCNHPDMEPLTVLAAAAALATNAPAAPATHADSADGAKEPAP